MSKKSVLMVVLLISIFLLTSGAQCPRRSDDARQNLQYHTGTRGLTMSFMPKNPPDAIFDTDILSVILELKNEGTYALDNSKAKIKISGFDQNIVVLRQNDVFPPLEPKSVYNPEGGYGFMESRYNVFLPGEVEVYSPKLQATACYMYETVANPTVCIDPGLYDIDVKQKACDVKDVSVAGGQGAPVAVTKVETNMVSAGTGDAMSAQFKIYIQNSGSGQLVKYEYCPDSLEITDLNRVHLDYVALASGQDITGTCQPVDERGEIILRDGKAFLICKTGAFNKGLGAFTTPLEIRLSYDYMEQIEKKIDIKRTPR